MNILSNKNNTINRPYLTVSILGKNFNLDIKYRINPIVEINKKEKNIILYLPKKYKVIKNTNIINMAIEKLYSEIAEKEIENLMEEVRMILGFAPEDYKLQKMENTFCKSSKNKIITINPEIMKYNKRIIITTLIQAFCKTKYKTNSKAYKQALLDGIEKYENYQYRLITKIENDFLEKKAI